MPPSTIIMTTGRQPCENPNASISIQDHDQDAPYMPPTTGIISLFPPWLVPYAELMRLGNPGFIYICIPGLFGAFHAAYLRDAPALELLSATCKLLVLAVPATFFSYSYNDTVDARFDRKVARTRHRPIARGAISLTAANLFNLGIALCCYLGLYAFPPETSIYALIVAIGSLIYPLSKRFTMLPQVVFGFVMATGVLLGSASMRVTPFVKRHHAGPLWRSFTPSLTYADCCILWLYAANVVWAICYEIIYSFQDVIDDAAAGVGTITLIIRGHPKQFLSALVTVQTVLFLITGIYSRSGMAYFVFGVGAMASSMAVKLFNVDLTDPESCMWWFSRGALITGGLISTGLFTNYLSAGTV